MNKKEYNCKYCGKKMHKFDYETYKGYCGKCREVLDWKRTLDHIKEYEKQKSICDKMGWFKDQKEKRKLKKYMKKSPEEEYAIYKRRLLRGEYEESARAGLKHLKRKRS